jgi:hypothetical protein
MTLYNNDSFVNRLSTANPRGKVYTPREIALFIYYGRTPSQLPTKRQCPTGLRRRVLASFKGCEYCGKRNGVFLTVDRVIPGAAGGRYEAGNVTAACGTCNSYKRHLGFIGPVRTLQIMEGGYVSTRS